MRAYSLAVCSTGAGLDGPMAYVLLWINPQQQKSWQYSQFVSNRFCASEYRCAQHLCRHVQQHLYHIVQGFLQSGPPGVKGECFVACCDHFISYLLALAKAIVFSWSSVLWDSFQIMQHEDMGRIGGGGQWRPTTCALDLCPSGLIKDPRPRLVDWLMQIINCSLSAREGPWKGRIQIMWYK